MSLDNNNTNKGPINPVRNHPFQVVYSNSPEGALEEKQFDTDYHVRIDVPGVPESGLTITKNPKKNEIRFRGKVPTVGEWPECVRTYASVIRLNTSVNEVKFQHTLLNGCLNFVFHGTTGELQLSKSKGGKAVDQSNEDHLIFGDLASTSSDGAVSSIGKISLTKEKCEINPLVTGFPRSCILHKWVNDGGPGKVLHLLLDTPGMDDFKFDVCTTACVIRGALEENTDDGQCLKTERSYFFSMKFGCGCCIFDRKKTKKDQILKDGLLRLKIRVLRSCKALSTYTSSNN